MGIKDRLSTLRIQAGKTTETSQPALAERLTRLQGTVRQNRSPKPAVTPDVLARMLKARLLEADVILVERRLSLNELHGNFHLTRLSQSLEGLPEAENLSAGQLLFLDTETTGLAGGTGTLVFMLGMARLTSHSLELRQYLLTGFAGEAVMLGHAAEWINSTDTLVSFNGKCFDVPLLSTRCRLAAMPDVFSPLEHLDLLHTTRRAYGRTWGDCRLISAEQRLLGFHRENDLPGAEAPQAWFDYIHRGDASRLPGVSQHNQWDLISLVALLPALVEAHTKPHSMQADIPAIARSYQKQGRPDRALALLAEHRAVLDDEALLMLADFYRRQRQWRPACEIWERLAERNHEEAIVRLAKYHEHVNKDYRSAIVHTERLAANVARESRLRRLRRKSDRLFERFPETK